MISYIYSMNRMSKSEIQEMINMYESGNYNFKQLDIHFKRGLGTCAGLLLRRGYKAKTTSEINRKYSLDETFFDKIDSREKAYMLGFIYADGCNFPEGSRIVIGLQERDKEILEKFKILLGYNRPLQYRKSKDNSSNQYVLTISSRKISDKLVELGVVKAKSLILTFPKWLDKNLYSHFIRGYFDGDGCITRTNKDIKWSLIGTSDFVSSIQKIMIDNIGLNYTKLHKRNNVFYLEYKGRLQAGRIMDWLYKNSSIHFDRKYNKFKEITDGQ